MADFRRTGRRALGVVIVGSLAAAVIGYALARMPPVQAWIAGRIFRAVEPSVRFARARLIFWPTPGVLLEDVSSEDGTSISAASIRATVRLVPLLTGTVDLASVRVVDPDALVDLAPDGQLTPDSPLAAMVAVALPFGLENALRVPDVEIVRGRIRIASQSLPGSAPLEMQDLNLDVASSGKGDGIDLAGSATCKSVTFASFQAEALKTGLDYRRGKLAFHDASLSAYGGIAQWTGALSFGDVLRADGEIDARAVDAKALLASLVGGSPNMAFDTLAVHARIGAAFTAAWQDTATGAGDLILRGGSVESSSILQAVWHALLPRLGPLDPLHLLHPLERPTHLDRLRMPFELSAGRLSTRALELVTSDYTLSGRGSIGADGSLDLTGEVRFTVDGLQKLIAMASLPIPTGKAPELPPIPTKITGTLRAPIVRPDVSVVSRSSVEALFAGAADGARWVGRTMGEVEGSLEKGVGALRGLAGSSKRHR